MAFLLGVNMRLLLAALVFAGSAWAAGVDFSVVAGDGLPLKDVLVIVQTLERSDRELCRSLTDAQGLACRAELTPGLYRAIATTPYGLWNTRVREFWVAHANATVTLQMTPMGTHGYGDIVTLGLPSAGIQVLQSNGEPAPKALVIVRDREATLHLERFYMTDAAGKTSIELTGDPTVLVVVFNGTVLSQEVSKSPRPSPVTVRLPAQAAK